jgi:hypothetical protein
MYPRREQLPTHSKHRRIRRDRGVNLLASATVVADKLGDDVLSFWLYVTRGVDLAAKQINYLRLATGHRRRGPHRFSRYHSRRSCHRLIEPEQTISSQAIADGSADVSGRRAHFLLGGLINRLSHVRRAVDDNKLAAVALARLIVIFAGHLVLVQRGADSHELPDVCRSSASRH